MSSLKYDAHAHVFHPKIAAKATQQLYDYYRIPPAGDGTLAGLLTGLRAAGLDRAVAHCAATTPAQVVLANDWAIHLQSVPEIEAFGTFHPDFAAWEKEFDRLAAAGVRGLKLHPDFQKIWLDDPQLSPMFEAAAGRFVMMFHIGDERRPDENFSSPQKLAAIKRRFPQLTMIAAHLGGYLHWRHVVEAFAGLEIFVDTSSALPFIDDDLLTEIRLNIPLDRWLFGSDFPLAMPATEIGLVKKRLQLNAREFDELLTRAGQFFA
ncbi:amidohydrolase [Planctomycetales bacterium]|nr:amidohydrolase [Planctomycetales bacterium]